MNLDFEILRALRAAGEGPVSGADLSQRLGVSRAAIWARVRELRSFGYEIEASPHRGYRLLSAPDLLHADDLLARLGATRVVGRDIRVFEETTSTNDLADRFGRDGAREGVVIFSESQTRGRGRLGRRWLSPPRKGLWFSVLLRPPLRPQNTTWLTLASAVALRRALEDETGLNPQIKWPNDILVNGLKVAGILTEISAELDRIKYAVVGIGVDVNLNAGEFQPDLRKTATSLKLALGHPVSRPELAVAILRELDADYQRLAEGRFDSVAEEWERHCVTLGQQVVIRIGDREIHGRAESLGEEGALLVRTEHGRLERVVGGDVTLESAGGRA
jgi:BirA family biotin operon repressor/biotin-[acetyl-CoA-carboxylase] ligase